MEPRKPTLAVFWGDTRKLLSYKERLSVLPDIRLESMTPNEILLRDTRTMRPVVVTSVEEDGLSCDLCDQDVKGGRHTFGNVCPRFAECLAGNGDDPQVKG